MVSDTLYDLLNVPNNYTQSLKVEDIPCVLSRAATFHVTKCPIQEYGLKTETCI